jgi:hypothetical protein
MSIQILAKIITSESITLILGDGQPFQMTVDHDDFYDLHEALRLNDVDEIEDIVCRAQRLADRYEGTRVAINNGHITVDGNVVNGYLVRRILEKRANGDNVDALVAFLDNVMNNPSYRAVQDLYAFLERTQLPLTEDGCFLAYKGVRNDFTDHRTGSYDNSPGKVVRMPRNEVDENPERTCSNGLHACGSDYLTNAGYGFGNDRIVLVKINPANVVAFPNDYDLQKLRCCEYEVLMEVDKSAGKIADALGMSMKQVPNAY